MDFDVTDAMDAVRAQHDTRIDELTAQMAQERSDNEEAAGQYARHLAAGGDPTEYDDVPYERFSHTLLSRTLALNIVYVRWNKARGGTNPVSPIQAHTKWRIAEALHASIGTPVLFSELSALGNKHRGASSSDVMTAAADAQTDTLIARKVKLDGKVAYMLRVRVGEEEQAHNWNVPEEKYEPVPA